MRVRYHWIRGKEVRTKDRRRVGRVADLVAEAQGDALYVTTLLVGAGGVIRRMSFKRRRLLTAVRARRIPWRLVAEIGDEVHLLVDYDELQAVLAREEDTETGRAAERRERTG